MSSNENSDLSDIKELLLSNRAAMEEQAVFMRQQSTVLQQQQVALVELKKQMRSRSPPPEKLDKENLDVRFHLNHVWIKRLKQAMEAEDVEEMSECVGVVVKDMEVRNSDMRFGDKEPDFF